MHEVCGAKRQGAETYARLQTPSETSGEQRLLGKLEGYGRQRPLESFINRIPSGAQVDHMLAHHQNIIVVNGIESSVGS